MMRYVLIVLGLLLIGAGAVICFGELSLPSKHEEVQIGRFPALLTTQRPIPPWLGAFTALTGLAIALLGTRYRR
jgi:hypothetical protein